MHNVGGNEGCNRKKIFLKNLERQMDNFLLVWIFARSGTVLANSTIYLAAEESKRDVPYYTLRTRMLLLKAWQAGMAETN